MTTQETRYDIVDDFNWQSITDTFDENGDLISRETRYDSGFRALAGFTDGVRTSLIQYDEIGGGDGIGANWSTITSLYDASGALSSRVTEYDNDTRREEYYIGGVRSQIIETDFSADGSAANWQQILTSFDINGDLSFRTAYFDDGVVREDRYESGVQAERAELDIDDARDWNAIRSFYDANGDLDFRRTQMDDRTVKEEDWSGGNLVSVVQLDQSIGGTAAVWQSVVTTYDSNGDIATRNAVFDDGLVREETFAGGQRVSQTETDTNDLYGSGSRKWHEITTTYDANGNIATRTTTLDNGIVKTETLVDGQRSMTVSEDVEDRASWDTLEFIYDDAGQLETRTDTFDNGDQTISTYENGNRALRIEFDADGDRPWELRVADFENGTNTAYDSIADAPVEIQAFFDLIV